MNSTSESLLLRLGSANNSKDWSRFVELYTPLIFFWARKTGLQSDDASDLVQDVLSIVFQKLPGWKYDPQRTFRGWLRTVTINRRRELARRKRINMVDVSDSALAELPGNDLAKSTWDLNYARHLVSAAVDLMKDDFATETWVALKKLLSTGRSVAEISRETGVNSWTLYSARSRLLARLRQELNGLLE